MTPATTGPRWMPTRSSQWAGRRRAPRSSQAHSGALAMTGSAIGANRPAVARKASPTVLIFSSRTVGQLSNRATSAAARRPPARAGSGRSRREADDVAEQHGDVLVAARLTAPVDLSSGTAGGGRWRARPRRAAAAPRSAEVGALLIAQALLLEAGADPRPEQHAVERLRQIVLGAELDAADHALDLVHGRDHDHRDVAQRGSAFMRRAPRSRPAPAS